MGFWGRPRFSVTSWVGDKEVEVGGYEFEDEEDTQPESKVDKMVYLQGKRVRRCDGLGGKRCGRVVMEDRRRGGGVSMFVAGVGGG